MGTRVVEKWPSAGKPGPGWRLGIDVIESVSAKLYCTFICARWSREWIELGPLTTSSAPEVPQVKPSAHAPSVVCSVYFPWRGWVRGWVWGVGWATRIFHSLQSWRMCMCHHLKCTFSNRHTPLILSLSLAPSHSLALSLLGLVFNLLRFRPAASV